MIVSLCPSFSIERPEQRTMDQSIIKPRFYADTFGGEDYDMDLEENLGYRTPFLDADAEKIEALFAAIAKEKNADV